MDIGTSGIRGQALELSTGKIISTSMTEGHPLPGANILDHITFSMKMGRNYAHELMIKTVNQVIAELDVNIGRIERVAICGNPIELSIFQNIPVDDLAFTGERAWRIRGIVPQKRNARIIPAVDVGLDLTERAELVVPPAIKHEVGADALAMLVKSGFLEHKGNCLITDYGTNAEMALKAGDEIYVGSASAGPAIEGQHIKNGMLAGPGAISDLQYEFHWRCRVLDNDLIAKCGDLLDLPTRTLIEEGKMHRRARGVTGTGMIATLIAAMHSNLWKRGKVKMPRSRMELQDGIYITNKDMIELCKALGAMRAGHFTLVERAGIKFEDLKTMFMAGASGTYIDPMKARIAGLVPPSCEEIHQIGNTSLAMATDLVRNPGMIDELQTLADNLHYKHVMFATDEVFEKIYIQELAHWTEGMSMDIYNENLKAEGIQPLPPVRGTPQLYRSSERDIAEIGEKGLRLIQDIGMELFGNFDGCDGCKKCQKECPGAALKIDKERNIRILTKKCLGTGCYRCQYVCPQRVCKFAEMKLQPITNI